MKLKKKLPKFNLGAMPDNIGYLRSKLYPNLLFLSNPGISLKPEARAAKLSLLGNSISNAFNAAQWPLQAYLNMTRIPAGTALKGVDAINSAGGISSILKNGGTPTVGGALNGGGLPTEIGATTGKASTVVNGLSKLASVAGIAMGAGAVYNSFAHQNDMVSQDLIANSASTNVITTDGGNTYTERGGIDAQGIRDLQHQMDTLKKVNLAINAAGLGASIGSLFTPIGGVIGAGAGFALGSIANLLGFGDNEEEIELAMRDLEDVFAMLNRLSRAGALDKDTKAEFYNRAVDGKRPVWTPTGLIGKKATARVSNGEVVGNFEEGIATRIPGLKNNKDTKLAALKDGDFVISNKYGLSDYAAATGDYAGALNLLEMLMGMRNSKGYKCGKLPGFKFGWDSALSMLPHVMSFMTNQSLYNRAKNADTYAPDTYVDNAEGAKAVNELAQLRYDATPYYREAQRGLNLANWDVRRQVGLGMGGRAIAQNANFNAYLNGLAKINATENEANTGYRTAYANALAQLGARNQEARINSNIHKYGWQQQANAAKENWMAQYLKNRDTSFLNGVAEWLKQGQYKDSLAAQNRMLNIYEMQANTDRMKVLKGLPDAVINNTPTTTYVPPMIARPEETNLYVKPASLLYTVTTPTTLKKDYKNWNKPVWGGLGAFKNGKLPKCEDGLVDTRSDTTYRGYNPNPIPWGAGSGPAGQGPLALLEGADQALTLQSVRNNPHLQTGVAPSPMSRAKKVYDGARKFNSLNDSRWWKNYDNYYDPMSPLIEGMNIGLGGYGLYNVLKDKLKK